MYLEFAINKICSCQPSVVLVEKSVARGVVEKLNDEGITLVGNVPLEQMETLALCTGAPVRGLGCLTYVIGQIFLKRLACIVFVPSK